MITTIIVVVNCMYMLVKVLQKYHGKCSTKHGIPRYFILCGILHTSNLFFISLFYNVK